MEYVYVFLGCFLIYFSISKIYAIITIKNKKSSIPNEVRYLVRKYHLNMDQLNIRELKNVVTIANALLCSVAFTFGSLIDNTALMLLVVFICMIPALYFTYDVIGKYYAKKGQ